MPAQVGIDRDAATWKLRLLGKQCIANESSGFRIEESVRLRVQRE